MKKINYKELERSLLAGNLKKIFSNVRLGLEKESLRVNNSKISHLPHPKSLGSSLCNKYITTDFSEAQLELITTPVKGSYGALEMLDDIHHFVTHNIEEEIIWPLSIPPRISKENDVPIAKFGNSHEGMFKHIYRQGLASRYGRVMQSISGVHFNYSLPDEIWDLFGPMDQDEKITNRSKVYFNIIRNIYKNNWILIYLFGASPVLDKKLMSNTNDTFKKLDENSYYLPFATSLRMSEYGYSNSERRSIDISLNSIDEYASDLRKSTLTIDPKYEKYITEERPQLNANLLQIEAEFYAIARAKSNFFDSKRPSTNLLKSGVEFVEIRTLDLNPFSRFGINQETIKFMELFLLQCFIEESPKIGKDEINQINQNDLLVAKNGRDKNQKLNCFSKEKSIKEHGKEMLDRMIPYAELMDQENECYMDALRHMRLLMENPEETLSARIIEDMHSKNLNYTEFGNDLGYKHREQYLNIEKASNNLWEHMENEAMKSLHDQKVLEKNTNSSSKSFEEYKEEYADG